MNSAPTILVAEDDPVFRRLISFSMEAAGLNCLTAANGIEAVEKLSESVVDVLVTDHQMPGCSGLELIERLRGQNPPSTLPIILCTAKGFELDACELTRLYDLVAVIRKPFSPRQLVSIVIDACQRTNDVAAGPVVG